MRVVQYNTRTKYSFTGGDNFMVNNIYKNGLRSTYYYYYIRSRVLDEDQNIAAAAAAAAADTPPGTPHSCTFPGSGLEFEYRRE